MQAGGAALSQKRSLAAAAHADDGERLAGDRREAHVPAREASWTGRQGLVELGAQNLSRYCHSGNDNTGRFITL